MPSINISYPVDTGRKLNVSCLWLFHDGGLYHIETSPLIWRAETDALVLEKKVPFFN